MMFSTLPLVATFALAASALPQGTSSSTSTSTGTSTGTSSATPSSSSGSTSSGGVNIINNLNTTVYAVSTASTTGSGGTETLSSGGGSYSENWQTTSDGSGISIKLSTSEDESSVLQFEYTNDGSTLYWDLSSIDLDESSAFVKAGFSASGDSGCSASVNCAAGDADCAESYQNPDDVNTNSCDSSAQITLTLG
ncbi:hypothetical protein BJY01DRAFT_219409 [Aspergillus pseudoustus]|uniref:GPI anchored cell wall protein n=1 Tax=Aspergillus pseudoustus TaxID=1810923 RepID=A0ABR4JGC4_9EURO